jgi:hypothetical protein
MVNLVRIITTSKYEVWFNGEYVADAMIYGTRRANVVRWFEGALERGTLFPEYTRVIKVTNCKLGYNVTLE